MIYELRTYTLVPGTQAQYLKLNAEVGRKIRGDKYGKLEGAWTTEFATLNQYVHLWGYPDLDERDRLRGELAKNEEWSKGYVSQIRPMILAQENKILSAVLPLQPPGRRRACLRAALVPDADGQGRGVAQPLQGHPARAGEVLAPRGSLADRDGPAQRGRALVGLRRSERARSVRAKLGQDPEWQAFLGKATPLLAHMQSTILTPTTVSPMK